MADMRAIATDNVLSGELRPLIWVSRTLPAARESAAQLTLRGFDTLVAPLLAVESLQTSVELRRVRSLVFTSRQGVAAFINHTTARHYRVFAVGDATAAAARAAGFRNVLSAAGDVGDLRRLVLGKGRRDGAILRVGAEEPAGALIKDLAESGFEVAEWSVYRTVPTNPQDILSIVGNCRRAIDAVLIYSPKAARQCAGLLQSRRLTPVSVICISQAAAVEFGGLAEIRLRVAERPNEASMFEALQAPGGCLRPFT